MQQNFNETSTVRQKKLERQRSILRQRTPSRLLTNHKPSIAVGSQKPTIDHSGKQFTRLLHDNEQINLCHWSYCSAIPATVLINKTASLDTSNWQSNAQNLDQKVSDAITKHVKGPNFPLKPCEDILSGDETLVLDVGEKLTQKRKTKKGKRAPRPKTGFLIFPGEDESSTPSSPAVSMGGNMEGNDSVRTSTMEHSHTTENSAKCIKACNNSAYFKKAGHRRIPSLLSGGDNAELHKILSGVRCGASSRAPDTAEKNNSAEDWSQSNLLECTQETFSQITKQLLKSDEMDKTETTTGGKVSRVMDNDEAEASESVLQQPCMTQERNIDELVGHCDDDDSSKISSSSEKQSSVDDEHRQEERPANDESKEEKIEDTSDDESTESVGSDSDAESDPDEAEVQPNDDKASDNPGHILHPLTDIKKFVFEPAPKNKTVKCRITRQKSGIQKGLYPVYYLHMEMGGGRKEFLLAARKRKRSRTANYLITVDSQLLTKHGGGYVGKLRSDFLGLHYTVMDTSGADKQKSSDGQSELAGVFFERNILRDKGPRRMTVIIPGMKPNNERISIMSSAVEESLVGRWKNNNMCNLLELHNKPPSRNLETGTFALDFHGRVTKESIKNFQIVHKADEGYIIMQFGRIDKNVFTMDYCYPLCAVQAFGIALSSFDYKIACE